MLFRFACVLLTLATTTSGASQSVVDNHADATNIRISNVESFGINEEGPKIESDGEKGILVRSNPGQQATPSLDNHGGNALGFGVYGQQGGLDSNIQIGSFDAYNGEQLEGFDTYIAIDPDSGEIFEIFDIDGLGNYGLLDVDNDHGVFESSAYGTHKNFNPDNVRRLRSDKGLKNKKEDHKN